MMETAARSNNRARTSFPGCHAAGAEEFQNAILLIDKPEGKTSHEIVKEVQRLTGADKIGHSGTLDRFASGILVLCTGQATKLARYLLEDDKSYSGTIRLGITTDTDDREGTVIEEKPVGALVREDILEVIGRFRGEIVQVPPQYSALKIKGKRASDRVRKGEMVTLNGRKVRIYDFSVHHIDMDNAGFNFHVRCSKGTYIRSLARDIGRALGTGAHLEKLRRISSGLFNVDDAVTLMMLDNYVQGMPVDRPFIVNPVQALRNYGMIVICDSVRKQVLHGANFNSSGALKILDKGGKMFIIVDEDENLIAIADVDIQKWHIKYLNVFNMDKGASKNSV
jgi:tRNA pseudouridine55 synthase